MRVRANFSDVPRRRAFYCAMYYSVHRALCDIYFQGGGGTRIYICIQSKVPFQRVAARLSILECLLRVL